MLVRTSSRHALAALVAALAIAVFAGCGSKSGSANSSGTTGGASATAGVTQAGGAGSTGATAAGGKTTGAGTTQGAGKSTGGASGAAGGGTKTAPSDTKGSEPPPIQLLAGDLSGIIVSKPTVIVVHSEKQWEALQKQIFSHGVKPRPVSGTDFSTRQIIGLFMPKQPKGTLMSITEVRQQNGKLVVAAAKIKPGKRCKRPAYKTNPFHLVDTRQMAGRPVVILETVNSSPC